MIASLDPSPTRAAAPPARAAFLDALARLRERHPLKYFKLGTEVEALSFEEIAHTRDLVGDVPILVKIGGPGASNDVRVCAALGARGLIGPMIESAYGLRNFLATCDEVLGREGADRLQLGINLETAGCHRAFSEISTDPAFSRLAFCNIGRSDLAASMGRPVADPEVTRVVRELIRACRARAMAIHVGGQVTGQTLAPVLEHDRPDGFHTRFLAFSCHGDIDAIVGCAAAALELEMAYLAMLAEQFPARAAFHLHRREVTCKRLEQQRAWLSSRTPPRA